MRLHVPIRLEKSRRGIVATCCEERAGEVGEVGPRQMMTMAFLSFRLVKKDVWMG